MELKQMHYAKIRSMDISNGPYTRVSLFTQGCSHHCFNCFNPETWKYDNGNVWNSDVNEKIVQLMNKDYIKGLSILGGDPFFYYTDKFFDYNNDMLLELVKLVKTTYPDKSIWLWTGYVWEDFFRKGTSFSYFVERVLEYIDVVVDGPFMEDLKNPMLKFCGSSNQRVIDVKESFKEDKIVTL